ncbi:hypothetical protein MYCTH_2118584 [Thermothelomyces thermophilus ATCC 42464]|uniref:Mei2-like C-terminal RNA recognition motif domain-containing protein n=1 Tax=Thermothelomyces thermophilus (strain ATCC 42464 / BCRC 31852 / DSM 1799) TaxID=573729 RepID=G2QCE6_THET4|nr:uncharacterized protein MYCTH_2118584 [Thermothelomyces thermophilus ATCC 42464]AEO58122.1 hypothetical protein MYCTH_2118584 [Thermothelomyces thermophilus ATCC 42464]
MAHMRDASLNPSSPHSSSAGADSYKHENTPDTRLTVFSPDDNLARPNKPLTAASLDGSSSHVVQYHANTPKGFSSTTAAAEKDPFISNTAAKAQHKLSPTALVFRPVSAPLVAHGSLNMRSGTGPAMGANRQLLAPQPTAKFSSEMGISRYLVIYSPSHPVSVTDVEGYLAQLERFGLPFQGKRHAVAAEGRVFLYLPNVRDARNTLENVQLGSPNWCAKYIVAAEFYKVCNSSAQVSPICDGKVQITAYDQGVNFGAVYVETVVHTFLDTQGEVFALLSQSAANNHTFRGVVEFSDADVAISVVDKFNRTTLGAAQMFRPLENNSRPFGASRGEMILSEGAQQPTGLFTSGRLSHSTAGIHKSQQFAMYPVVCNSFQSPGPNRFMLDQTPTRGQGVSHLAPMTPISGGMPMMAPLFNTTPPDTPMAIRSEFTSPRSIQPYARLDGRRHGAMRANRSHNFNNAGHHNHVDVNRIRDGVDVRTTIMLRNIPNKVDQVMLKRIIDESSWGKYDFMYLRIDFANDCNSSMRGVISAGTASRVTRSPRSPMLRLLITGPRPELAGQEEPFPEPDNLSKMRRSCENAEHIGLFTPNAGQHFREEQRRRRSQYDRGTRLAALEEYDYAVRAQQHGLFNQK